MATPVYSIIIPVYNRPEEVGELLESLTTQTYKDFEVLIVEDGSQVKCDQVVEQYKDVLSIQYYFKANSGQGFSRNFGYERAQGEYFIVFDSDCIIPSKYLEAVDNFLTKNPVDAFGGPDKALKTFTPIQQAISYSMTSLFTTGGIRGSKKRVGTFHPRSFNMGISREVFQKTGGYIIPRMGEDIEFSIRIMENGFKTALIHEAYVYHKRRTSFQQFFKQLHFFGRARINIGRYYPNEVKLVHWFPAVFTIGFLGLIFMPLINRQLFFIGMGVFVLYSFLLFIDAWRVTKSFQIALFSWVAALVQLLAYGIGFLSELFRPNKST